jgi:hypothetical protein
LHPFSRAAAERSLQALRYFFKSGMAILKTVSLLLLLGFAFVAGFFLGKSGYFEQAGDRVTVIDDADEGPEPEKVPMPGESEDEERVVAEPTPGEEIETPAELELPSEAEMAVRAEQKFVILSDKEGRELNGEILEMAGDTLKVRRYVDFRIVEVPVALLSPVDQAFIAYLREVRAAAALLAGDGEASREERLLASSAQARSKPSGDVIDYSKYGRKGANARKRWLQTPEKDFAPDTKAYCDALWMRVHEEDCPLLVLKDKKKVITLAQADSEGWRIGESGQSGRSRCCFHGYRRQYPEKDFTEDSIGVCQYMKGGTRLKWHQAGCHRFSISADNMVLTQKEGKAFAQKEGLDLFYVCTHCIERGPGFGVPDFEALKKRPTPPEFTPPAGWSPEVFSADKRPSRQEVDMLIEETLSKGYGIQEAPYVNPLATLEEFMGRRFFFGTGLNFYRGYRATGDKRILESLRVSARHYRDLSNEHPGVAQAKARDTEHMTFLSTMAISSRLTLQLARKHPDQVSREEIAEAESFLKTIVSTLEPLFEEKHGLDPEMGLPKKLADDFRNRPYNRAQQGIGTFAMTAAALKDYQAIKKTTEFQPQIDLYRRCVAEYYKNWKDKGCLYTEADGRTYFYYAYSGTSRKRADGLMLGSADDVGHYGISMNGVMLAHDATPELGPDEDFMRAVANAVHHNSYTKNGSIQCPTADKIQPLSRHPHNPSPKSGFYMFEAFRDGVIEGQGSQVSATKKTAINRGYSQRLNTLYAHYLKALQKDRSLVHLGDAM